MTVQEEIKAAEAALEVANAELALAKEEAAALLASTAPQVQEVAAAQGIPVSQEEFQALLARIDDFNRRSGHKL